ncbi:hypothetical protein GMOD_00009766 [Pyrenophora seminiperda CCB06]|uniref:Uncharacterized protein n=1 Tax=Pyrenophora seminiperda CCB06 TaxID=1302712 RepID=A0A3M7MES9_9PLEO|nr:hypothetical protein GMOD_00009766 [Pyrenophora seminiperda CCB06]
MRNLFIHRVRVRWVFRDDEAFVHVNIERLVRSGCCSQVRMSRKIDYLAMLAAKAHTHSEESRQETCSSSL